MVNVDFCKGFREKRNTPGEFGNTSFFMLCEIWNMLPAFASFRIRSGWLSFIRFSFSKPCFYLILIYRINVLRTPYSNLANFLIEWSLRPLFCFHFARPGLL